MRRADNSIRGVLPRARARASVCLTVCDLETSIMNWPRPNLDCRTIGKETGNINICYK